MPPRSLLRRDGRQSFLAYLKPEIIRALKTKAASEDTHAYLLIEAALAEKLGIDFAEVTEAKKHD